MTLDDLKNALLTVMSDVFHYKPLKKLDKYIVWAEDGQAGAVWADDMMQEQALSGTVDYFTKMENDPNVKKIHQALKDMDISFKLNSVQREEETGYIHYEWTWEQWQE